MKEKMLMTSVFFGGFGDVTTTAIGLARGFEEAGILGKPLVESDQVAEAFIIRIAATAIAIGCYALTQKHDTLFAESFDKAMKIGNVITWGMVAYNTIKIVGIN